MGVFEQLGAGDGESAPERLFPIDVFAVLSEANNRGTPTRSVRQ